MKGLIDNLLFRRIAAGIVVSAISLILIGGVVLTMTSAGCGPSRALHLTGIANRCAALTAGTPRISPTSIPTPVPAPGPASPSPPYQPPASNPNPDPGSGPYPPYNPGASAANPYPPPASGSYPPFILPASINGPQQTYGLTCSLPVFAGGPGSGGFITFPGGNFIADPRSAVTLPSPSPGSPSPPPQMGYGPGFFGLTYDRAFSLWLPVPFRWVAPDGSRYAYPSTDSIIVQNVADAGRIELGRGRSWTVLSVETIGVYASNPNVSGLWLLPFSGTAQQVTTGGYWQAVAAGFAYGTETSAVPQGAANVIVRLDLRSGAQVAFFTRPGSYSMVYGFDANGSPIVNVSSPNGIEIWLAPGPNTATVMVVTYYQGWFPIGVPIADGHGIWFPGNASGWGGPDIVLFVPGQGLHMMAKLGAQLAGGCA